MTRITRRQVLHTTGAIAAALTVAKSGAQTAARAAALDNVKALVFDVFGTVVDWRNGVARDAERILEPLGYRLDWLAFADAWRALYQPSMEEVRSGREPFVKLDVLHRRMLERVRPQFGLEKLDGKIADELNLAWHRLDAWPDVAPGFARCRAATALAAPVRSWPSLSASMTARTSAWSAAKSTTTNFAPPSEAP